MELHRTPSWRLQIALRSRWAVLLSWSIAAAAGGARGAQFSPIAGLLQARAGNNATKFAAAVYGPVSLSDQAFNPSVNIATASLNANVLGGWRFNFDGTATSSTNVDAVPPMLANATSLMTFEQQFVTTTPQWIQVSARVDDDAIPQSQTEFSFGRVTSPPLFMPGDTAGVQETYAALLPPGTYRVLTSIDTSAEVPGSRSGAIEGNVTIAALADFDASGAVAGPDFNPPATNFGAATATFATGDVDGNSVVDGADLLFVQKQLGSSALPAVGAIPEPTSGWLMTAVAAARLRGRRRR